MVVFMLLTFFWFFLGAAIGSFLNVIIQRSLSDEQWVRGRSHCDHCRKVLPWYDLIPILSYFFLRGRSRCCHKELSISHPVVEFLTGSLFVWWYWGGAFFFHLTRTPFHYIQPLFWLLVGIILLIIFLVDWWYLIIPDWATFALLGLTSVYRVALTLTGVMQVKDFVLTFGAMGVVAVLFYGLYKLTKGKGLGFGDVKFSLPLTLLLGWPNILVGLFAAFITGSIGGITLLALGKAKLKQPIPFGPYLVVGTAIALLFGDYLISWYVGLL